MRTATEIEQRNSLKAERKRKPGARGPSPGYKPKPSSLKNLAPYPKGVTGNPGGLPGTDVAARIARHGFQLNEAAVYEAMTKELLDGKPYAFDVLAKRAYGAVKERIEHTGLDGAPLAIKVELVNSDTES